MKYQDPLDLGVLIVPVIESLGYQLWGVEFHQRGNSTLLRVFIDHENGINLDDCSKVSQQLSALLDVENPISVKYVLEVSSPGVNRVLFSVSQFRRYLGECIKLRTHRVTQGRRNFVGQLKAVDETQLVIHADDNDYKLSIDNVARARLHSEHNRHCSEKLRHLAPNTIDLSEVNGE